MATALDTAGGFPPAQAILDAGHVAMMQYVSPDRPGSEFASKPVTLTAADTLRAGGVDLASNWQYGKPGGSAPSDWTTGFDGGARMAAEALANHFAAGGPGYCPIFFSVDEDISLADWNSTAVEYFRGINSVIGKQWTGIYGHSRVCAWAIEDDVVGHSTTPGKRWCWQTRAWSGDEIEPAAVLYQRVIDTPSNPGPVVGGIRCDVNDILAADWGQWQHDRTPKEGETVAKPHYTEIQAMGNSRSNRWGARITNALLHTQEGDGSAESLARYLNNSNNGVSYHYTLRDGILYDVVDTDYASWSVLDANSRTINLCFAGSRAAWSREQWLQREGDIRIAAWVLLQDCIKYGFSSDVNGPPYRFADGISDHRYVTDVLDIGSHTDVGPHFPWDVMSAAIAEFRDGVPAPAPVNMIDQEAARAAAWIGARITEGENVTPDDEGRWAQFEHGYIYWTPDTGAHAIPTAIFEPWAELGWETSTLGYPIGDHTVLPEGVVQGFENGAMYRKNDRDGYFVTGLIRARWNRSGYEGGPLGWPVSNEIELPDGSVYQDFEHGRIVWSPDGTVALQPTEGPDQIIPDTH